MKGLSQFGLIIGVFTFGMIFSEAANAQSAPLFSEGISNQDAFSGPTWSVNDLTPSTQLNIEASGFFDLINSSNRFPTNAAGVLIQPTVYFGGTAVGSTVAASGATLGGGTPFGALLLGNASIGFVQVFPNVPGNGLGSSTPPTNLSTQVAWGTLFPSVSAPFTGTLQWRVNDSSPSDNPNVETMQVEAFISSPNTAPIPTPALLPGLIGMGAAALRKRKQEAEAEA